jgi:phosphoribosylaminoimidazole (AIR) synthetase
MPNNTRTYLDVVPEGAKERLSRTWGLRKHETFRAAKKHGIELNVGQSFNQAVTFKLKPGLYHITSGITSVCDISDKAATHKAVTELMDKMIKGEKDAGLIPILASNVCDWDSKFATDHKVNIIFTDAVIATCIANYIVLTGGETANVADQVRKKGMSWMFTLISRATENMRFSIMQPTLDTMLDETFGFINNKNRFEIIYKLDIPLLFVKKPTTFLMTADGTGSKSIIYHEVGADGKDISDTLAMCGDDAPRDGGFPILASIGVHAEDSNKKAQIVESMRIAGIVQQIPIIGSVFHVSSDVSTYTMNGVVLSCVDESAAITNRIIVSDLPLVLLPEEQRSNGITLQRRILEEAFGSEWYHLTTEDALFFLNRKLGGVYGSVIYDIMSTSKNKTLAQLVATPSTPYFRADSTMPREVIEKISLRINVSSGGLFGKTRRLLEPLGLGAAYYDLFETPEFILILQLASRLNESKWIMPDEKAYYTFGCGTGAVIGTTNPIDVLEYYHNKGIIARLGGITIPTPHISISSTALDSKLKGFERHILVHTYTDQPLG